MVLTVKYWKEFVLGQNRNILLVLNNGLRINLATVRAPWMHGFNRCKADLMSGPGSGIEYFLRERLSGIVLF